MNLLRPKTLKVTHRADGKTEDIQVIEVGFKTFLNCCGHGGLDTELAEAAVRCCTSAGVYDRPVMPGWLDELTDDSADQVIAASNELNITAERAKKAGGRIDDRIARQVGLPLTPKTSGEPSSS